jgi:hypothetical protein
MRTSEITDNLQRLASDPRFAARSREVTDALLAAGAGIEAVEPILRFMEANPHVDFGTPGALVHFVERFFRKGYEEKLVGSVRRKPTPHTLWMLSRLINGVRDPEARRQLVAVVLEARANPLAGPEAVRAADHLLARLAE